MSSIDEIDGASFTGVTVTLKVIKMGDEIKNYFVVPIDYFDERFSSDVIFKEMRKANLSRSKIKNKIDQQAAAYILQGYLEKHRNNNKI